MAIKLTTTSESSKFVKALIYGDSGSGKTWLCKTVPSPVIISAEKGLLTLQDDNFPVIEIASFQDLEEAYIFVTTHKSLESRLTVCLDSISDIAETVLSEEKELCGKDPRAAYGNYNDKLYPLIKKFRDISNKHIYFTAKMKRITDEFSNITSYVPSMPGQQLGLNLPYLFDFVFALRVGENEFGEKFRYMQTNSDIQYLAKSRGGKLESSEPMDLGYIFKKGLANDPKKIKQKGGKNIKKIVENKEKKEETSVAKMAESTEVEKESA